MKNIFNVKTRNRIIIISILLGLFAGVMDAILDAYLFYNDSLINLLFLDVPAHETYIRSLILFLFVLFGILLGNNQSKIEKINSELLATNQQLAASEQQLLASNQQLTASEQQLMASNQQLIASEQQLMASNQQLTASEQQLMASNQQLTASEQQLMVSNQQLIASEQELIKSKEKAEESDKENRKMLENLPSGVVVHSPDTSVLYANPKALQLLGLTMDQMIGKTALDPYWRFLDHNKSTLPYEEYPINKVLASKTTINNMMIGVQIDDKAEITWVLCNALPQFDTKDEINKAIISFIDITERVNYEELQIKSKVKAEESDRLKSAFLANMSHEIRTPMNAILGFSSLLKKENLTKEKKEQYWELIDSGGNRLLNIISDIVDISKLDAKQLSINYDSCNLNLLIDNLQNQFNIHKLNNLGEIKISKDLSDDASCILTDETRLIQIISNLIENSLKFTQKGSVEFGYVKNNMMLEFFVKDTGIGIDKTHHSIIFDRFKQVDDNYSKSDSGTGLGLSIAKSLTELLGGEIWLESEKNKGATFYFTIPYNITEPKRDKTHKSDSNLDLGNKITILIAEDEYSNYIYAEALLEDYQCNIIHAKNGKEAIDIVKNRDIIDLILMDFKMPVLNGLEATKKIREIDKNIPIVALTAYAMSEDKQKALEAGCNDYLAKPLSDKKLTEMMKKHLKKDANRIGIC